MILMTNTFLSALCADWHLAPLPCERSRGPGMRWGGRSDSGRLVGAM